MRKLTNQSVSSESGFSLIVVAWLILILSLMASVVLSLSLTSRKTVAAWERDAQAKLIAESAVDQFMTRFFYDPELQIFRAHSFEVMGVSVDVEAEYESAKLNINRANVPLLSAVFASRGLSENEAINLAAAIVDWRDIDDVPIPNGAEADAYVGLPDAILPRDGPFETVGELKNVKGMSTELFVCLSPDLTVYSLNEDIEISYASSALLSDLGWAYNRVWFDETWPDPETFPDNQAFTPVETVGGQAFSIKVRVGAEFDMEFYQIVRFKSITDRSFATLTPLKRNWKTDNNNCPN